MIKNIITLAGSTAIALVGSANAFAADNIIPAAEIRGNGASGVAVVVAESLNCFGNLTNNPIGFGNGTTGAVGDHLYQPVSPTTGNPIYDCAVKSVQDNVEGYYISTGSSAGKNNWKNKNAVSGITTNPFGTWTNIHYAWSESPINAADLTTYNTAAAPTAGAPIQLPLLVFSVGFSYMPLYGKYKDNTGTVKDLTLNLKYPRTTTNLGGLRLKKTTYCGIVNGTITNWNDAALKADNGGQSLMDADDDLNRWNTTGVPIKLVGRQEGSGTTNVFTRAMTAQCGGKFTAGGTDLLPAPALNGANTAVYDKVTGLLTSGVETAGFFGVANGNDGVANAVSQSIADPVALDSYTFAGYLGYNGADWLAPTVLPNGKQLHSAQLQQGTTTAFKSPVATDATAAFKGILPPQSDSKGKYLPTDLSRGLRSDPLAWVVPATTVTAGSLANPALGYPIVGTGNVLIYTCYANQNVRNALQNHLSMYLGKVTISDDLTKVPAKLLTSTAKDSAGNLIGLLPNNGFAPMPAQWATAMNETFLTKTTTGLNPSSLNLWIQNVLQKNSTNVLQANPACDTSIGGGTVGGLAGVN